jgi:hypothetical protein
MTDVPGDQATPGEFRRSQNWIGQPGSTLATASFIPTPPGEVEPCLVAWEKFLYESELPPLVTIALAHYQFEAVHPFLDGTGRFGRLLITLYLIEQKILPAPLLYLSAFFEATRRDYNEGLRGVSERGAWNDWLELEVQSEPQQRYCGLDSLLYCALNLVCGGLMLAIEIPVAWTTEPWFEHQSQKLLNRMISLEPTRSWEL